jgi:curved DNA-binding protein CbpA
LFLRRKFRRVTDNFALLDQPRRPWIDLKELEEKYHALARTTHPDQSKDPAAEFAEVNKAYRVLRDPKLRLEHLLALEGREIAWATSGIPADLDELFMQIAPAMKNGNEKQISGLRTRLEQYFDEALKQLHALSEKWNADACALAEAEHLQQRFSFLTRWKEVLAERTLR